jgi:hypothetical protein
VTDPEGDGDSIEMLKSIGTGLAIERGPKEALDVSMPEEDKAHCSKSHEWERADNPDSQVEEPTNGVHPHLGHPSCG